MDSSNAPSGSPTGSFPPASRTRAHLAATSSAPSRSTEPDDDPSPRMGSASSAPPLYLIHNEETELHLIHLERTALAGELKASASAAFKIGACADLRRMSAHATMITAITAFNQLDDDFAAIYIHFLGVRDMRYHSARHWILLIDTAENAIAARARRTNACATAIAAIKAFRQLTVAGDPLRDLWLHELAREHRLLADTRAELGATARPRTMRAVLLPALLTPILRAGAVSLMATPSPPSDLSTEDGGVTHVTGGNFPSPDPPHPGGHLSLPCYVGARELPKHRVVEVSNGISFAPCLPPHSRKSRRCMRRRGRPPRTGGANTLRPPPYPARKPRRRYHRRGRPPRILVGDNKTQQSLHTITNHGVLLG